MKTALRVTAGALVALCLATGPSAQAEDASEIAWDDLLPPAMDELDAQALALREKLFKLDEPTRKTYRRVASQLTVKAKLAGGIEESDLREAEKELLAEDPISAHPEATAYWAEYETVQQRISAAYSEVSPTLDGKSIRMPGYLLPIEFDGDRVREFLLVPYVGACVHTPPPPRNQVVFVSADEGYASSGLFDPVWVEGDMSTQGATHSLNLVDGTADVDVGYTLKASKIEPYIDHQQ